MTTATQETAMTITSAVNGYLADKKDLDAIAGDWVDRIELLENGEVFAVGVGKLSPEDIDYLERTAGAE
jgi:hypothetical protein